MSRVLAAVGLISLLVLLHAAPAFADGELATTPDVARVAVLPFAGEGRMALYGQPVAAQVAKVARAAGFEVRLLTAGGEVAGDIALVVDGRLVKSGAAILVEARVRDPERGVDVARRSATATSLAMVDRAADEVAAALVPAIRAGLIEQEQVRARAAAALAPPPPRVIDATWVADRAAPVVSTDPRPLALIALTGVVTAANGQTSDIAPLVAQSLVRLADRIGHRAEPLGANGLPAPAATVAQRAAALAIVIAVLAVETDDDGGIPRARARARIDVYDGTTLIYRRTVRTDTLVGSRGDRPDTLVRSAVAQVVDVVAPRLREHLAAAHRGP